MEAGKLRHRVTIEEKTQTQDGVTGDVTHTWTTWAENVPAAIEPLSGREFVTSAAQQAGVTARITIRWREGVTADMRIVHNGTLYNIAAVLEDNNSGRSHITMPCSRGVSEG